MQGSELNEAMELAHVYRMNTVIVHPDLILDAQVQRVKRQAKYKILTTVDWPKGDKSGISKFRSMSIHSLSCDGFEIALGIKSQGETKAETLAITNFIRTQLPQVQEIRFILGCLSREQADIDNLCLAIKEIPAPNLLRTDINLRCAQAKANISAHSASLAAIQANINRPIKLCGNINSAKVIASCKASRYGVSLKQAQTIIKELKENPDKIQKIFK
jgi:hypothetical protein